MNSSRTDPILGGKFKKLNQKIWAERSKAAEEVIRKMLNANNSLFEIYEYARDERRKITEAQYQDLANLTQKPIRKLDREGHLETFGYKRDVIHYDKYTKEVIAGSTTNSAEAFMDICTIVEAKIKKGVFKKDVLQEGIEVEALGDFEPGDIEYSYREGDKQDKLNVPELDVYVKSNKIVAIRFLWCDMDDEIYKEKLEKLNKSLNEIKQSEQANDETLAKIGLLAYDLSRLILLMRGSSAVNGWIIRELVEMKGFEKPEILQINKLPFDVYAQIQTDRNQYARDFVASIPKKKLTKNLSEDDNMESKHTPRP